MARTDLLNASNANRTPSNNIGASKSPGHKKRDNLFINSFISGASADMSYVTTKTRGTIDVSGQIVNTGIYSDIAIEGPGMIPVSGSSDSSEEMSFTRRGDFRQDKLGYLRNGAEKMLYAWKLDDKGRLPQNPSMLSSLEAVNFANIKGTPIPTTVVSIAMNLSASKAPLRGAGVVAQMQRSSLNASTGKIDSKDIIFPEQLGAAGLSIGDSFTFTSTPPGVPKTITYGAIAVANAVSTNTPIYGAQNITTSFAFGTGAGQVINNSQLKITVDGTTYSFTAVQGSANADARTFNTIQNLAAAINKTGALTANIDAQGRLYIAPVDASKDVVFTNANGGTFVETLGLIDIPRAAAGENRFNSLYSLQGAVNKDVETYSLKATLDNGNIRITSLLATDDFSITATSSGVRSFRSVTRGDGTDQGRATVKISSPAHNLQTGDLVRIAGVGGQTPDGVYAVGKTDLNGFEIYVISNNPSAAAGGGINNGFPVTAAPVTTTLAAATWQKIPGQKYSPIALLSGDITNPNPGGTNIQITKAGHGLANDDIVYISGFGTKLSGGQDITIPDGYYRVSNVLGNVFQITAAANVPAAGAPPLNSTFTILKVGSAAGGFGAGGAATFNSNIMVTVGGHAGPDSTVRLFTTSNNYNIGDYISFSDLAAGGAVVDGVRIENGKKYKITAVDRAAGTIDFTVVGQVATTGDGATGMIDYTSAGFGRISINNGSRLLAYFGLEQNQESYSKVYDPRNIDRNLSKTGNFAASEVFSHPLKLYDSLGQEFTIVMKAAKLSKTKWAVEFAANPDKDGNFDIAGIGLDGRIIDGTIEFDENGRFVSATNLTNQILIQRKNGSQPSYITIDWENQLSEVRSGSVTQFAGDSNVELVQQNGQPSGTLTSMSIDTTGTIIGIFSSGETRKLYQIPIAMFANFNGLQEGFGGTYSITKDSGELLLKVGGTNGAGKIIGGALESSNTDITSELLDVQELGNFIRANARTAAAESKNVNTILSELQ